MAQTNAAVSPAPPAEPEEFDLTEAINAELSFAQQHAGQFATTASHVLLAKISLELAALNDQLAQMTDPAAIATALGMPPPPPQ